MSAAPATERRRNDGDGDGEGEGDREGVFGEGVRSAGAALGASADATIRSAPAAPRRRSCSEGCSAEGARAPAGEEEGEEVSRRGAPIASAGRAARPPCSWSLAARQEEEAGGEELGGGVALVPKRRKRRSRRAGRAGRRKATTRPAHHRKERTAVLA